MPSVGFSFLYLYSFTNDILFVLGSSDVLQKMNDIRDMQEKLTIKHFEIDQR